MSRLRRVAGLLVTAYILIVTPTPPSADVLVADLSEHLVAITTGFSGTTVLLFGAIDGEGDVVVVVRGPERPVTVRRKDRVGGVWINQDEMTFVGVPAFYGLAASRPIEDVAPEAVRRRGQIGVEYVRFTSVEETVDPNEITAFRLGLIRNKQQQNLYAREPEPITFLGNRLFRTDIYFPANAPVGQYVVEVLMIRDGEVVSGGITPLVVSRLGFEARVFDFAHRHSLAYGVLAILIAAVAGWLAGVVFHKG